MHEPQWKLRGIRDSISLNCKDLGVIKKRVPRKICKVVFTRPQTTLKFTKTFRFLPSSSSKLLVSFRRETTESTSTNKRTLKDD